MSDVDYVREAVQEKIRNDIEDRVYEKIKSELRTWKFLGFSGSLVGGALITLIVAFHEPIFKFIVENGSDNLKKRIEESVKADLAALEKQKLMVEIQVENGKTNLEKLVAQATNSRDEIFKINEELAKKHSEFELERERLDALVQKQKEVESNLEINELRVAAALSKLSQTQLAVDRIEQGSKTIASITAPASVKTRSTVYFQFAGFQRETAVEISKAISKRGWDIPGEQRSPGAANTNQIRYSPADEEIAKQLKIDSDAALRELHFDISLALQSNPAVKPGIPEIWIWQR